MPQVSPMKWIVLNLVTQSSIIQAISFLSMKKPYNINMCKYNIFSNKMNWKW